MTIRDTMIEMHVIALDELHRMPYQSLGLDPFGKVPTRDELRATINHCIDNLLNESTAAAQMRMEAAG
jgi:hypothetical protein